jgi:hypothetical protein
MKKMCTVVSLFVLAVLLLAMTPRLVFAQYQTYQGYNGAYYQPYYYQPYLYFPSYYTAPYCPPAIVATPTLPTAPAPEKLTPEAIDAAIQELTKRKAALVLPPAPVPNTSALTADETAMLRLLLKKLGDQPK